MDDVDLWVRVDDLPAARRAMREAGFEEEVRAAQPFSPFENGESGEIHFRGAGRALVELHYHLICLEWLLKGIRLDEVEVWRRSEPRRMGKGEVRILAAEDTLLHLCLHLAVHQLGHAKGYQDIDRLVRAGGAFRWDRFVERAWAAGMRAIVYFPLEAAARDLGTPVPEKALAALRPPALQRRLVGWIAGPGKPPGAAGEWSNERGYLLHLALMERVVDAAKVVGWLLFPGAEWLRAHYFLRGRLPAALACAWHPLVVAAKGAAGVWAVLFER